MGSLKIEYAEGAQAYHKCSQPIVLSVDAHLDGVIAIHHEVMNDIPSGLLHPDGVQRIRSISHDIASAKENVACAHSRLTEFLDKGTIPEEFEIVLVVLIQIMRHDLKA